MCTERLHIVVRQRRLLDVGLRLGQAESAQLRVSTRADTVNTGCEPESQLRTAKQQEQEKQKPAPEAELKS